jgi:hypothetical protein
VSYQDLLGPLPETPIGRDFDLARPTESFLPTARGVAFQPKAFFAAVPRDSNYGPPLAFALICAEVSALLSGILGLGSRGIGGLIVLLVATAIGGAIGLFVVSLIAQLLVNFIVGPKNAGYAATFRVASYALVTNLLSWIPVVGVLASLYGLYLAVVGIREVHQTTTGQAAMVVLIPVVVIGVIVVLVGIIVGLSILAGFRG